MNNSAGAVFSGSIPEKYDRYLGPVYFEPYALDLVSRVDVDKAQSVLEIACGTGRVTRHLKRLLRPGARLVATDINPDMLAVAKERVPVSDGVAADGAGATVVDGEAGMSGARNEAMGVTLEWQTVDAQTLPFPDEHFDLVVCQFGVMFVPDKPKAFAEAFRVLKKGGVFLFNTWDKKENNSFSDTGSRVIERFFPNKPPGPSGAPGSMSDEEELRALCSNAGFGSIQTELVKKQAISPSARDITIGMIEGSANYAEVRAEGEVRAKEIMDAVEKAIAAKYGDHPAVGALQAFVCRAEKVK